MTASDVIQSLSGATSAVYDAGRLGVSLSQVAPKAMEEARGSGQVKESKDDLSSEVARAADTIKKTPNANPLDRLRLTVDKQNASGHLNSERSRVHANNEPTWSGTGRRVADLAKGTVQGGEIVKDRNEKLTEKLKEDEKRAEESQDRAGNALESDDKPAPSRRNSS